MLSRGGVRLDDLEGREVTSSHDPGDDPTRADGSFDSSHVPQSTLSLSRISSWGGVQS